VRVPISRYANYFLKLRGFDEALATFDMAGSQGCHVGHDRFVDS
jgi:hypothetical protein